MENETKARMINTSKLELSLWAGLPSSWNWSQTLWNLSTLELVDSATCLSCGGVFPAVDKTDDYFSAATIVTRILSALKAQSYLLLRK